jgi:hypothetical protein
MITKALSSLVAIFAIASSAALSHESDYALIDVHGNVIIPMEYAWIQPVGKEHFLAHSVAKWHPAPGDNDVKKLFDKNGKEQALNSLTPPRQYKPPAILGYKIEAAFPSSYIVRATSDSHGKLGLLAKSDAILLPLEFDVMRYVGESRIFAMKRQPTGTEQYVLYDTDGKLVSKLPDYVKNFDSYFSEGLLLVGDDKGRAFVDRQGRVVIPPNNYQYPYPFSKGLAVAQIASNGKLAAGYVNKRNELVSGPFDDTEVTPIENDLGMIILTLPGGRKKYGAVNSSGQLTFPAEFDSLNIYFKRFVSGTRDGKFQLFRRTGELVATFPDHCREAQADNFDKNNIVAFHVGGYAPYGNGTWGYCDEHAKVIIEPKFTWAWPFEGEVAIAGIEDQYDDIKLGLIDRTGSWVVQPKYDSMTMAGPHRVIVGNITRRGIVRTWHDPNQRSTFLFERTLKYYDLIGMTEQELNSTLGQGEARADFPEEVPDVVHKRIYYKMAPQRANDYLEVGVEFGIDRDGRVWGWSFRNPLTGIHWVTENMFVNKMREYIPKRNTIVVPPQ